MISKRCKTCRHFDPDGACRWAMTAMIPWWMADCLYAAAATQGKDCQVYERRKAAKGEK